MDDVFDEDADELTVSKNEFNKIMENIEKVKKNPILLKPFVFNFFFRSLKFLNFFLIFFRLDFFVLIF